MNLHMNEPTEDFEMNELTLNLHMNDLWPNVTSRYGDKLIQQAPHSDPWIQL